MGLAASSLSAKSKHRVTTDFVQGVDNGETLKVKWKDQVKGTDLDKTKQFDKLEEPNLASESLCCRNNESCPDKSSSSLCCSASVLSLDREKDSPSVIHDIFSLLGLSGKGDRSKTPVDEIGTNEEKEKPTKAQSTDQESKNEELEEGEDNNNDKKNIKLDGIPNNNPQLDEAQAMHILEERKKLMELSGEFPR